MFRFNDTLYLTKYERKLFRIITGRRIESPVDVENYNNRIERTAIVFEREDGDDGGLKAEAVRVTKLPPFSTGLTILDGPLRPYRKDHTARIEEVKQMQTDLLAEELAKGGSDSGK